MNRIRKVNNGYQVLITPSHRFDSSFELMIGNWNDEHLRTYSVLSCKTYEEAFEIAYNYPDISWDKLVLFHKDIYQKLHKIIKKHLDDQHFFCQFEPHISSPDELKNNMFDRISNMGNRFRLKYNLNDIIGFNIINPWSDNLNEIYTLLKGDSQLRIHSTISDKGVLRMIGKTDIGTSYEIILWPTLVAQWAKWANVHIVDDKMLQETLHDILRTQKVIDNSIVIR